MEEQPATDLPATQAAQRTGLWPYLEQPEFCAAALYGLWAALAGLADRLGAAPLLPGGGLILILGAALTTSLFFGLARLPTADQPPRPSLIATQALMGIVWATLYTYFAGTPTSGAGLLMSTGMYLSAVALALPSANLALLGRLMVAAVLACGAVTLLWQGAVLGILFGVLYLAARALAAHSAELQERNAQLQSTVQRITRNAERDHLTNSYNRRSILEMVAREKARADRSGEALCICLLDIDHFKAMNDRLGHLAGDRILAAFARRMRGALRAMDTVNTSDLAASANAGREASLPAGKRAFGRVGGEEFIVLLPQTSLRGALKCAERLRKAVVRRPFDGLHQVTVSIGIAEYRQGESISSLIGRADGALYGAKNTGRNRVHCATVDGGPNAIVMPDIPAASM